MLSIWVNAQSDDNGRLSLKAAYVFNFTKLVQWPLSTSNPFINLCLPAIDSYLSAFQSLEKKPTPYGRIRLIALNQNDNIQDCHILFLPKNKSDQTWSPLENLPLNGTLIICEESISSGKNWIIGFFVENNKLRFNINLRAAQSANLKISSTLLILAAGVIQ